MTHVADDLPLLLTGEASRDEVLAAAAHLRACEDCRAELVSAVVAHASLSSARRYAPEMLAAVPTADIAPADQPATEASAAGAVHGAARLPDLSDVFAQVRAEAAAPRRSRVPLAVAAVAAAGIVLGGGATYLATHSSSSHGPAGRRVALAAYDKGTTGATAELTGGSRMTVDATSLPKPDADHRYEVWLTNAARTAMQPVGWIGEKGTASISVPASLMASYSDIEVSVQKLDAPYTYSGTSVLRGAYG